MVNEFKVTGMSCAACSARVEKAVGSLTGVSSCSVNLLTASMRVEGDVDARTVVSAVENAGYGAALAEKGENKTQAPDERDGVKREIRMLKVRLFSSLGFLALLMYISMGHGMLGLPLPVPFADSHAMRGLAELLLSAVILVINRRFFVSGIKGVLHRAPNMDTLVALGAGVSFLYSVYVLFAVVYALENGMHETVHGDAHSFYFESAGMILTLITLGKLLEARAKGKTTDAIRSLLALSPAYATVVRGGKEVTVISSEVAVGDIVVLRPGDRVPVDGVVTDGESAVDESALTGESIPVDKAEGMALYAGSINLSGALQFRATGVGEETALARIVRMVKDASATKAPIAKVADRVSGVFVPFVLAISLLSFFVWLFFAPFSDALGHAIAVLVISCPCALGLATPVAIMVGSGVGAKNGILFKTATSLEETGRAKIIVFDKTGTLTEGKPSVTDVIPALGVDEETLLRTAVSVEADSEHPLAGAILRYGEEKGVARFAVKGFHAHAGSGVSAVCEKGALRGGKSDFVMADGEIPEDFRMRAEKLSEEGKTPLYFSADGVLLGMIAVADTLKEDSAAAVLRLKKMGIRTVMLTGDNERTARAVAARVGIDEVIADVFPEGKAETVRALKKQGKLIMVGDGINDAPALTEADIGIAVGAGTDVALDAADVVLTRSALADVPAAVTLSRAALRNIRQNLFWAFFYNAVGIPLAAGVFVPVLGWSLPPMFGAAAMSLSSVTVVSNALRLRFVKIYEKKIKKNVCVRTGENGEKRGKNGNQTCH